MICERCGKEHDGSFGSGRFCSRSCANTRVCSNEQKEKISNTLKKTFIEKEQEPRYCEKCGKEFHTKDLSRRQCYDCLPKTIKYTISKKHLPKTLNEVSSRTISKIMLRMKLPCSCCGFYEEGIMLDLHHIIPKKEGGCDSMDNLTYICPNCHRIVHTDKNKLKNNLVSIEEQLKESDLDWTDFYYGYKKG